MPKSSTDSSSTEEEKKKARNIIEQWKEKMSKKRSSRTSTIPMVNRQAVEILEEFLKKHQDSLKDVTPMNSLYQKVSELEVNEEKPNFHRNLSYRAASHESLLSNGNNEFELFQHVEEEIETVAAPLASDEDSDSHVESPVSAPEASYYKRKSSADSSSSDSSEWGLGKRHKKSFFKRARERLRTTLKITKKNKKEREEEEKPSHKKKRKKGKKKNKNGKVLSEVTTVTKTHIRQSSTMSDIPSRKSEVTLRQGEVWESKDIKDKSGSSRHVKAHLKIKESTDSNTSNGLASSFRKLKNLHKSGRKSLSLGRKDKDVDLVKQRIIRRSYSDSSEKCIHVTKEESKEDEKSMTTKVFNEVISMQEGAGDDCCQNGGTREHLHLDINPVFTSELPATGAFEFESERCETVTTIQTPDGQTHCDRHIEHHEHLNDQLETIQADEIAVGGDETDGAVGGAVDDDNKEENKMAMYRRVASKLAIMADEYLHSDSEGACSASEPPAQETSELTDLEREIVDHLLAFQGNTQFPSAAATEILKQLTYNNFRQIVEAYTKDKNGVQEVVALFMLSKVAISIVGAGRALASQVKDHTLRYFEDKCAAYICERGGWDSVLEDTDEDTESKTDEQKEKDKEN